MSFFQLERTLSSCIKTSVRNGNIIPLIFQFFSGSHASSSPITACLSKYLLKSKQTIFCLQSGGNGKSRSRTAEHVEMCLLLLLALCVLCNAVTGHQEEL